MFRSEAQPIRAILDLAILGKESQLSMFTSPQMVLSLLVACIIQTMKHLKKFEVPLIIMEKS